MYEEQSVAKQGNALQETGSILTKSRVRPNSAQQCTPKQHSAIWSNAKESKSYRLGQANQCKTDQRSSSKESHVRQCQEYQQEGNQIKADVINAKLVKAMQQRAYQGRMEHCKEIGHSLRESPSVRLHLRGRLTRMLVCNDLLTV